MGKVDPRTARTTATVLDAAKEVFRREGRLHPRGPMAALAWNYQRVHGRRAYRRRQAA